MISDITFGLFGQDKTEIDGLTGIIDLWPEEAHALAVSKTSYPVETGLSGTDNAVIEPKRLVLMGWVSDLRPLVGGIVTISGPGRPKEAWGRIKELMEKLEPVTVITTLAMYENMLITAVDSTINEDTGQTLRFNIVLEEVLFAETEITKLPASALEGGAAADKSSSTDGGLKQSEETQSSLLKEAVTAIKGFF